MLPTLLGVSINKQSTRLYTITLKQTQILCFLRNNSGKYNPKNQTMLLYTLHASKSNGAVGFSVTQNNKIIKYCILPNDSSILVT